MGEKDFTFVEDTEDDNGYDLISGVIRFGEVDVQNVKELVDHVVNNLGPNDCISSITIIGHGSPGNISVGDGQGHDDKKRIGLSNEADWGPELDRIACRFCTDGSVYLRGCNTGADADGARLLHRIKLRLRCATIEAPTGTCNALFTTGDDQQSRPNETSPPTAIPNPDKGKKKKKKGKGSEVALLGGRGPEDGFSFEPERIKAARLVSARGRGRLNSELVLELGKSLTRQQREVLIDGLAGGVPQWNPSAGFDVDGFLQLRVRTGEGNRWLTPGAVMGNGTYYSAFGQDTSAMWILPPATSRMLKQILRKLEA